MALHLIPLEEAVVPLSEQIAAVQWAINKLQTDLEAMKDRNAEAYQGGEHCLIIAKAILNSLKSQCN